MVAGEMTGTALPEHSAGLEIGPFKVQSVLAEGGMGVVYRARHVTSGEPVALKTVRSINVRMLGALRAEIAALQAIHHPGVVRVIDQGLHQGLPWYAMELLEGRTLGDFNRALWSNAGSGPVAHTTTTAATSTPGSFDGPALASRSPSRPEGPATPTPASHRKQAAAGRLDEVLGLYLRLCAPLAHIHSRGIVHRDLKAGNVFVRTDGTPVLVDFGLISYARGTVGRESLGLGQVALGTVSHVSPEQIQRRFVDARADLYSLGCMLYQTVTGAPPFSGKDKEVLEHHLADAPTPPSQLVEGVPPELEALILGLLAKSPQDRIGYAADVADVLSRCLRQPLQPLESHYLYRAHISGRQELLHALSESANRMVSGQGGVVLLGGESGIGKTFLVAEFARQQRNQRRAVITGECVPISTGTPSDGELSAGPLHPFRRVFQALADGCRRGGPELARRLLGPRADLLAAYDPSLQQFSSPDGVLQAQELPAQAARERILQCLTDTLAALSAEGPHVLIFDDLQWADELTLAFLRSLTPSFFRDRTLLIVGTYRADEVGRELGLFLEDSTVHRIAVGRLDERTVETIARDMLAMKAPAPGLIGFLRERSEGNPFFVAEYLRLLAAEGILRRTSGRWAAGAPGATAEPHYDALPVPRSLEGIINRRVAGLDAGARTVIEAAAVIGRQFDVDVLLAMVRLSGDEVAAALREARNRQLIEQVDDRVHAFSHDKLRESTYAALTAPRLRELHHAAAVAIEQRFTGSPELPDHFAEIALHCQRAQDVRRAIDYLDKAAQVAWSKSANKEAIAFLKDAIALVREGGLQVDDLRFARWHRQIGDALWSLGQPEESARFLRQAAGLLGHPAPEKRLPLVASVLKNVFRQVLHRLFLKRFLGSKQAQAERLMEAARAHERLQEVLYFSGDALAMLQASISNLNLGEMAGTSAELTTSYVNAFAVAGIIPARQLAESYRRRAAEISERFPNAAILSYFRMLSGVYAIGTAAWDTAKRELTEGMELARRLGFRRRFEDNCFIDSVGDYFQGNFGQALSSAITVYASASRGDRQTQSWALIQRACVHLVQNQVDDALANLNEAAPIVGEHQNSRVEYLWFHSVLARALVRKGDLPGALAAANRAYDRMVKAPPLYFAWIEALPALAEVFLEAWKAAGSNGKALERQLDRTCRTMRAQARVFPTALPQSHLWQGQLLWRQGKGRDALACWEKALASARGLRMPYEEAGALRALALAHPTDGEERRRRLDEAAAIFRRLGAEFDLAHTMPRQASLPA